MKVLSIKSQTLNSGADWPQPEPSPCQLSVAEMCIGSFVQLVLHLANIPTVCTCGELRRCFVAVSKDDSPIKCAELNSKAGGFGAL